MIRTLSLFAGIGGFDLGLERTGGFKIVGQCEIDPFCRAVLKKHWPEVWCHDDVTTLTRQLVRDNCGDIDCICGGFPCQPHSVAGSQKGEADPRNLWPQFRDLVRDLQPTWIVAENVPGIRTTMADKVLEDMEAANYTCWPLVVGADDLGAPHRRKRVWFVAYRNGIGITPGTEQSGRSARADFSWRSANAGLANGNSAPVRKQSRRSSGPDRQSEAFVGRSRERLEHSNGIGWKNEGNNNRRFPHSANSWPSRPGQNQYDWEEPRLTQFEVGCFFDGLSERLVRFANRNALKAYGNAVVPQVVTAIGNAILQTVPPPPIPLERQ